VNRELAARGTAKEDGMPVYLVERMLRGVTMESLETLRRRTEDACRTAVARGTMIRYLRSAFTPGESRCQCLFEAPDLDAVREANDVAGFPYERIVLAIDLGAVGSADPVDAPDCPTQRS
jgi:hypothetical protein